MVIPSFLAILIVLHAYMHATSRPKISMHSAKTGFCFESTMTFERHFKIKKAPEEDPT
jgi:hypothetical protein